MVVAAKAFSKSILLFYRCLIWRLRALHVHQYHAKPPQLTSHRRRHASSSPPPPAPDHGLSGPTVVCDVEGGLLRSSSTFPYFMLVALEAGGLLRGLLLLVCYPLISCLGREAALRAMVLICFLGLRKEEGIRVGRAVLPKYFLEDVGLEGFEVLTGGSTGRTTRPATGVRKKTVCVSSLPRVMVESFLKEFLEVDVVLGRELKESAGYYVGLMTEEEAASETAGNDVPSLRRAAEPPVGCSEDGAQLVGLGSYESYASHYLFSRCKEVYLASEAEKRKWRPLRRDKYANPLVFHDGRIAFRPTPVSTLCMFLWLPFAFALGVARATAFILLPYALSIPLLALMGIYSRHVISSSSSPTALGPAFSGGRIYVSNHRTLLDPLYISAAIGRHVTATTYSVSRLVELLSPIRTIRLTRRREEDRRRMEEVLAEGDIVVCPEGTTCREPYLLRFSPLFAEVGREVVPVALESRVDMFYGTSTGRYKFLDPLYFAMNPRPCYALEFLQEVATAGGVRGCETANRIQKEIAGVLGYECTSLTRRDKYLMLAGTQGVVEG